MTSDRFQAAIDAIDAANADDPNRTAVDGREVAAEIVYGQRMTAALERLYPDASELLRLAARGQHIRRWTVPRQDYPEGRAGYLKWRSDLKDFHADTVAAILADCGYGPEEIARTRSLTRKERLKRDAETQALEDAACMVFLEHHFVDFAAKHDEARLIDIVAKTWRKMSPRAHAAALALDLPPETETIVSKALGGAEPKA